MTTVNDIRQAFLNYFAQHTHQIVPSSSLIPDNDPTLLFTNAGMNQFKNVFTGVQKPSFPRVVSAQKCVRAGGKHNDLENVGHTKRHHTFFEMLGNFSFGDYFKEKAIFYAWDFLTHHLNIPPKYFYVTFYYDDIETRDLWRKISGLSNKKLISIQAEDNFWSMGDVGPCGPCSEIFFDHGPELPGGLPGSQNQDGDRFVEIWNLVFMSYFKDHNGKKTPLPHKAIDTGMGLERIATVLQGKKDNYAIDLFEGLIQSAMKIYGVSRTTEHHRVLADHIRSTSFLIADGVLPSNEGRGYVLRRIMRRAMLHGYFLGAREPCFWKLVSPLVKEMGGFFSELTKQAPYIESILKSEEKQFQRMLQDGLGLLEQATAKLSSKALLPGDIAFKLYDTYGFPLDLTQVILRKERVVDLKGFESAMAVQKEKARTAQQKSMTNDAALTLCHQRSTEFTGHRYDQSNSILQTIIHHQQSVKTCNVSEEIDLLTDQTPFYGESGGQEGDQGTFETATAKGHILNTFKKGDLIIHQCKIMQGSIEVGQPIHLSIDTTRRYHLKCHHSATHLLHKALQNHLGGAVTQKGSLVAADRLRFDFRYTQAIDTEIMQKIAAEVNKKIQENLAVVTKTMTLKAAHRLGALALFGEKYADSVRVVQIGAYSLELCGGTHVQTTAEIGAFHILRTFSVASGVRRIEAVAGNALCGYLYDLERLINTSAEILKISSKDLPERVQKLLNEKKDLEKKQQNILPAQKLSAEKINGIDFLIQRFKDAAPQKLRGIADQLRTQHPHAIILIITHTQNKGMFVVCVPHELSERYNAIELARQGANVLGGRGGGGRADMAQAGGPQGERCEEVVQALRRILCGI